ncbi:MAG: hypothetical protein K5873_03835 [Treponema sp.]|nr:hypothetical protein [Treponema sp.]
MSTSLDKDLHSVYIDGEMPETFISQYEELVSSSEKEKASLEKLQALHSLMQEDAGQKTVSDSFAEESFARLQTKMRYAKNVSLSSEEKSFVSPFVKYASSFAAAAAVFALVFIPVHYKSLSNAKETAVAAISIMKQNSIEPIAKKDVIVSGNLKKEDLSKGLAVNESSALAKKELPASAPDKALSASEENSPVEQKTIYATNLASNYGARTSFGLSSPIERAFREKLTAVDPFVPDFSSSSITISVPNFNEIGNNMEIMEIKK